MATNFHDKKFSYKQDKYGNDINLRVAWIEGPSIASPRPIALHFHAGGLMVGSSDIIPKPQVEHLCQQGYVLVSPNYRLAPQATGKEAYGDCEDAYDWIVNELPSILRDSHDIAIDTSRVVTLGHSSGGTLALHIASVKPVKAVTAFYPSLYLSDPESSIHKPTSAPPFGLFPDYHPTAEEQATITPPGTQISEAKLAIPGTPPAPRNKWQMHVLKNGEWAKTICPDGDFGALDPIARVGGAAWPPTLIVQPVLDNVPGSGLELAERAQRDMKAAGAAIVELLPVPGETHMFDLPPTVGTLDMGPKWEAVKTGLDFLKGHV